jgi:hypothetical protein
MTDEEVEQNKQDREDAEELVAFYADRRPRFYECLRVAAGRHLLPEAGVDGEIEARVVAKARRATFPRGQHQGESPDEVPTEYVAWWLDQGRDDFTKVLEAYAKTAQFRERQRAEESSAPRKLSWME